METFNWSAAMPKLRELIADPALSGAEIAMRVTDDEGRKPTRNALFGYVHRNAELKALWSAQRKSRTKAEKALTRTRTRVAATSNAVAVKAKAGGAGDNLFRASKAIPRAKGERRVPLMKLRPFECKFSVAEKAADKVVGKFLFCGAPVAHGKNYCPHHVSIVFAQPSARRFVPSKRV